MSEEYGTNSRAYDLLGAAERSFIVRVYGWMTLGLFVTALAAFYTLSSPNLLQAIFSNQLLFLGLLLIELALVVVLSSMIGKLGVTTARIGFIGYAALNGVTLSFLALVYTGGSLFQVFVMTMGMFGIMSLYGLTTKRDLTSIGNLCIMALLGLIFASLLNLWLGAAMMDWVLGIAGVVIFVGLTAYDAQKLKRMGPAAAAAGEGMVEKAAVIAALALYLDVINLFLSLLRLFGKRK